MGLKIEDITLNTTTYLAKEAVMTPEGSFLSKELIAVSEHFFSFSKKMTSKREEVTVIRGNITIAP